MGQYIKAGLVFLVAFGVYGLTAFSRTPFNEQTRQATAILHGHLSIDAPESYLEHAEVGPYKYALHPPLAAFLLVPIVAVDPNFDQGWFGIFVGALDVMLAWILLRRVWLTVFFGFGTIIWYEAAVGSTWALPELVGVGCTLLVLIELFGRARPWLVGVLAGLGFLALYQLLFVVPVYAWMLRRRAYWILPGFLVAVAVYVALNEARFGVPYDMGLWLIPNNPSDHGPKFAPQYLAGNLYTLFFMAPTIGPHFPYIHPRCAGQALMLTSPAFVMALKPYWRRWEMQMMGACAILVAMPMLLCYGNGYCQFGARHYIPMYPYLLVMMGQARADQMTKILIVVSIILIGVGIWEIHAWGL